MDRIVILLLISFFSFYCSSSIKKVPLSNCVKISSIPGPEDLALDKKNQILYISSHDRRQETNGKLFKINLSSPNSSLEEIQTNYPEDFKPHGISLTNIGGIDYLYVISHPKKSDKEHSIEVFKIENETVSHQQSLVDETLVSPNDLFATTDGKIFVSNDRAGSMLGGIMDLLLGLKRSKISYYNGKSWKMLDKGVVGYGNGILVRKEGDDTILYRAGFADKIIYRYKWIEENLELTLLNKIEVGSGPDNLEESDDGSIYVPGHPSTSKFFSHLRNKENHSPSEIYQIGPKGEVSLIYADNGEELSAASTAIVYKDKIFIGQVFDDFILKCDRNSPKATPVDH